MNGAGRRRPNSVESVERANICAVHARTMDPTGVALPQYGEM